MAGGWLVWWCAWCVSASRASFVNTGFFQRRRGSRCGALHLKLQPPRQGIHQNGASRRLRCICQWFERGCGFTTCVCAPLTPCWFAGHRYLRCRARLSCRVQDDHVCVTSHLGWLPTPGESHQERLSQRCGVGSAEPWWICERGSDPARVVLFCCQRRRETYSARLAGFLNPLQSSTSAGTTYASEHARWSPRKTPCYAT